MMLIKGYKPESQLSAVLIIAKSWILTTKLNRNNHPSNLAFPGTVDNLFLAVLGQHQSLAFSPFGFNSLPGRKPTPATVSLRTLFLEPDYLH
ncbi:MAG: hypothetical protein HC908_17275 [Calothrix sp. SM1_7_51]|nr:hypothetical protein [Calothrix sp. SM1_7_51]